MRSALKVSGFTLVEVLMASAILVIMVAAIGVMTQTALETVTVAKMKTTAAAMAHKQIELARNMEYTDVGTVGGIPPGLLDQESVQVVGTVTYTATTNITYVDDPYDGLAPVDTLPVDYKRMRVSVAWDGLFKSREPVELWTDIAPKGLETIVGAGTLSIQVFNASGVPVSGAQVSIFNDQVLPMVDLDTYTDADGRVLLPGALACVDCYQITVTKAGYSTERTYSTAEVTTPAKPHVTVLEAEVSEVSFAIDVTSTVTFRAVRENGVPFGGVQMQVRGTKEIGRDINDDPVFKYDQSVTTQGGAGQVVVSGLEWDSYTAEIPLGSSVDFAGSNPINPFALLPGQVMTYTMIVVPATNNSLLVEVLNEHAAPVASGSVEVTNLQTSVVATKSTGLASSNNPGQAYFAGLEAVNHLIRAISEGYQVATSSVPIVGDYIESYQLSPL